MRYLALILHLITISTYAQSVGFRSMDAPLGARVAGLGGLVISQVDGDIMAALQNPAALDSISSGTVAIGVNPYFAGVYSFQGAYQGNFGKLGNLAVSINYLHFGDFEERAPNGDLLGEFQASDYLINIGKSHRIASFVMGANIKFVQSGIAGYQSQLLMGDIGGMYVSPVRDLTIGLLFCNFGFSLNPYSSTEQPGVPFDVQLGTTFKPEHMPFRFTLTAYNLQNVYDSNIPQGDDQQGRSTKIADKMLRHLNIGTELILHPKFTIFVGYNHLRQQSLRLPEVGGVSGLSFGLGLQIKALRFQYAHAQYHVAGSADFFTLQSNLNSFNKLF